MRLIANKRLEQRRLTGLDPTTAMKWAKLCIFGDEVQIQPGGLRTIFGTALPGSWQFNCLLPYGFPTTTIL